MSVEASPCPMLLESAKRNVPSVFGHQLACFRRPQQDHRRVAAKNMAKTMLEPQGPDIPGQPALQAHMATLTPSSLAQLKSNISDIDFARVQHIFNSSLQSAEQTMCTPTPLDPGAVLERAGRTQQQANSWCKVGLDLLASGKAAVILLAGGQGTRLGYSDPKGCFDIGLPSKKSLFQLHAERLLRLQTLASHTSSGLRVCKPVRWYIMTSGITHNATVAFFRQHSFFGLLPSQVVFFQQGTLPCLTAKGQVVLSSDTQVERAPDGNGGLYLALRVSGALADMQAHGVECVDCVCVDNALARLGDPLFLGACSSRNAQCGARVVSKAFPSEKVGVFARRGAVTEVVEYSEMDPADASSTDDRTGELAYKWSNICMHYFQVPWLASVTDTLLKSGRYHIAHKKIPSRAGPVDGIKLEQFIFDTFQLADEIALVEVLRRDEFSPVKNGSAPGASDSPDTARCHVLQLHTRWVEESGGRVECGGGIEVSPLVSYAGEGLSELCSGKNFTCAYDDLLQSCS